LGSVTRWLHAITQSLRTRRVALVRRAIIERSRDGTREVRGCGLGNRRRQRQEHARSSSDDPAPIIEVGRIPTPAHNHSGTAPSAIREGAPIREDTANAVRSSVVHEGSSAAGARGRLCAQTAPTADSQLRLGPANATRPECGQVHADCGCFTIVAVLTTVTPAHGSE